MHNCSTKWFIIQLRAQHVLLQDFLLMTLSHDTPKRPAWAIPLSKRGNGAPNLPTNILGKLSHVSKPVPTRFSFVGDKLSSQWDHSGLPFIAQSHPVLIHGTVPDRRTGLVNVVFV
jgi:hypothetical protein